METRYNAPQNVPNREEPLSIKDIWNMCLSHWYWFAIAVGICLFIAAFYILKTTPVYTRSASVLIKEDAKGRTVSADISSAFSDLGFGQTRVNVNNEIVNFKSPDLMYEVVKNLNLNINYWKPGRFHDWPLYGSQLPVNIEFLTLGDNEYASLVIIPKDTANVVLEGFVHKKGGDQFKFSDKVTAHLGDTVKFMEGYKYYKDGVAKGLSSVSGKSIEIYYQAFLGHTDKAVQMAREELGEYGDDIITNMAFNDSINNVILSNSMKGIEDEIRIFEAEREAAREKTIGMAITIFLLLLLITALSYIVYSRRRHMQQLKVAYEHALESDRMKTAFIRNINHEVRTPLNIISGFAQVISDPNINMSLEERQNISQMVIKNTDLITSQFDEMIELSLNENAGEEMNTEDIDINTMLTDIAGEHKSHTNKGVDLQVQSQLPEGFTKLGNKKMLYRMVTILLDNAIKNTTEGHIYVKAETKESRLTIAVEDTGCGIAPEEADRIFERFVKLNNFKEGLGLGLTLCRMLAQRMGGDVILDTSYVGPGARFVINL